MKNFIKTLCLLLSLLFAFGLFGCANNNYNGQNKTLNLIRFNTNVHIEVYGKPLSESTSSKIKALVGELDGELSITKNTSKVTEFNAKRANERVELSDTAIDLIKKAKEYYTLTDGGFNFAVQPLSVLWGFKPSEYPIKNFTPPTDDAIDTIKPLCNPSLIEISDNAIYKTVDGAQIDLGGIAKGYATQQIAELLKADGHTDGYVSIGTSSLYILNLMSGENVFSVRHPRKNDDIILSFTQRQISNSAVSTSGDYERFYEVDGVRYSHIIDGTTGKPANTGVISATVLGGDACFTDALSTALCVTPRDKIGDIITAYPELRFFVVYQAGNVKELITNQTQGDYTLRDDSYKVVKI